MKGEKRAVRRCVRIVGAVLGFLTAVSLPAPPLSAAPAKTFSLEARAGYFVPADAMFREIYGNGAAWGGEFGAALSSRLSLWAGVDYFSRAGRLLYTRESTTIRIVPLQAGLKLGLDIGSSVRVYAGAGLAWFQYRESNSIATLKQSGLGFVGRVGFLVYFGETFFLDFGGAYSSCRVDPAGVEADLGGYHASAAAGFRF
jgi:hypothetical protein